MLPKPKHLGIEYARQFQDASIAHAYHHRPAYPAETFAILAQLVSDEPRIVLDVGSGTGDIARFLVDYVERVDAVDFSAPMLAQGQHLAGGKHPHLHWIHSRIEDIAPVQTYALITAGESLHWMEWDIIMPRFRKMLTPHGYLALIERANMANSWDNGLYKIIQRFSTNHDYSPYDIVEELEKRHLFKLSGKKSTTPISFVQPIESYIDSFHSQNGFSRERMSEAAAIAFDREVRKLVAPFAQNDHITLQVTATIRWGIPID